MPLSVLENIVKLVPVRLLEIPNRACMWNLVNGVEGKVSEDGAVVGETRKNFRFRAVRAVGKKEIKKVVVTCRCSYRFR